MFSETFLIQQPEEESPSLIQLTFQTNKISSSSNDIPKSFLLIKSEHTGLRLCTSIMQTRNFKMLLLTHGVIVQ